MLFLSFFLLEESKEQGRKEVVSTEGLILSRRAVCCRVERGLQPGVMRRLRHGGRAVDDAVLVADVERADAEQPGGEARREREAVGLVHAEQQQTRRRAGSRLAAAAAAELRVDADDYPVEKPRVESLGERLDLRLAPMLW